MRKISFILLPLFLCLFFLALRAEKIDVTGDWELTTVTPQGERTRDINFVQKGEDLTVTTKNREGQEVKSEGTVKDKKIEWTTTMTTPRGEFTMTYKGTVEGDKMSGEVQMGDFGTREWKAERKKK